MTIRHTVRARAALARDRVRRAPRHVLVTWSTQAVVLLVVGSPVPGVEIEG